MPKAINKLVVLKDKQMIIIACKAYNLGKTSSNHLERSVQDDWLMRHLLNSPFTVPPPLCFPLFVCSKLGAVNRK